MVGYTAEEKSYKLLKGNILKRMEAERISDAQMAAVTGRVKKPTAGRSFIRRDLHIRS